jgi:hypothetical protein
MGSNIILDTYCQIIEGWINVYKDVYNYRHSGKKTANIWKGYSA